MLPEYVIYEELKRLRQLDNQYDKTVQLEIPHHIPFWPEEEEREEQDRDKNQIDILIINM